MKKYGRDFKEPFYGIEACLFRQEEDVSHLVREARARGFAIGVHFPLRAGRSRLRDALFLSRHDRVREDAFERIREELEYLVRVKPKYVLFHYPKPVVLDDRVDWSAWRFADREEYVFESEYGPHEFFERSEFLFQWLSIKSDEYGFTPVLEFDALNRYVYETDCLENLLKTYDKIKVCLDIGRLHLQDMIDPFFGARRVIDNYAKYAEVIHLWNFRYRGNVEHYRHPVLPELSPQDGWAPVEQYLKIVRAENKNVKILFEHRSDLVSDEDLERCYEWVYELWNGGRYGENIGVL